MLLLLFRCFTYPPPLHPCISQHQPHRAWRMVQHGAALSLKLLVHAVGTCFYLLGQARFFAASLILALIHLHEHGIVHGDVRPEHVYMNARGTQQDYSCNASPPLLCLRGGLCRRM